MGNNISREFYLLCKADGITILNSKADIARMVLTAKNNGFNYSETELKKMFDEGKSILKQEQEIIRNEKKQEKITELRSIELKHIEEIKVISKYIGTEKPISVLQKQISELQQELYSYSKQEKDAQELGLALYKAGEMKEKDWAIHGGIASGLAGGAAGLATALDIQQQNAQAREHNKQLMSSVVRMQMGATSGIYEAKERINERISKLRNEIEAHKKRLVEELQSRDLLIKLNPQVKCQKYTETGAIELKIETQPTPDIKIYDEITAVVDGSFKALLIDGDDIVGEVLFALPDGGATKKHQLIGYCVDAQKFNCKKVDVVFVPINLWAIEEKGKIADVESNFEFDAEYINYMVYYSAKDILKKSGKGIAEYEDAISLLECAMDFEKAKILANECKSRIKELEVKQKAEKLEKEKKEQAEREEKERIAKRNKKIAIIVTPIIVCIIAFIIVLNSLIIPQMRYDKAMTLMENKKYEEAIEVFSLAGNIKDSEEQLKNAVILCNKKRGNIISAGYGHTVGLKKDGTVVATKYYGRLPYVNEYHGQCDVSEWTDIVAISAGGGHTLGLKSNGTVIATRLQNSVIELDVENWTDITAISAGDSHAVGLKSDGTVVATGYNKDGQCNVSGWTDIVAISAGKHHTVGLKSNGTVVAVGDQGCGVYYVSEWTDIIAISAGECHIVGLKSNGTVVAVGNGYCGVNNVSNWTDIIAISAGGNIAGLKSDGTVVIVDEDAENKASDWKNIIAISDGPLHTVGLKTDGEIVAIKADLGPEWFSGQCDVQDWNLFK